MPRRILFVTWQYFPVQAGGAEHQARLQAEELVRRGHRVTVVCPKSSSQPSGLVNGVFVRRLPSVDRHPFRTITFAAALTIYLLFRLRSFALVHVHLAGIYVDLVVPIAQLLRRPSYVKIAAGGESGEVRRLRRTSKLTRYYGLRHVSAAQALSEEIAAELRGVGVPAARIVRIPNGVPTATTASSREAVRRRLDLPLDETIVAYLGRFSAYKGVNDLVAAWRSDPPLGATLLLVGYRPDRPPEEQIAVEPGDGVLVREWVDVPADYLRATDIFVLPSRAEGMSNVLLEALSIGTAAIATRVGAAEDMIEDGVSGLLIDAGDRTQLATALHRLCADPTLRATLATQAARRTAAAYSIESVVDRIEPIYERLIAGLVPKETALDSDLAARKQMHGDKTEVVG